MEQNGALITKGWRNSGNTETDMQISISNSHGSKVKILDGTKWQTYNKGMEKYRKHRRHSQLLFYKFKGIN